MATINNKFKIAKIITFVFFSSLLLSFCIWQLIRPTGPSYFFWVVQTLPLIIFIPGMIKNNPRTYICLCFVILAYFIRGVEGVMHPVKTWIEYIVLSHSIFIFISAMLASRWAAMIQKHKNSEPNSQNGTL